MHTRERTLTEQQLMLLFVIGQNEPTSVVDVKYHTNLDESSVRGRLATLERRGLLDRQHTGHDRGRASFAYVLTDRGQAAVNAADIDEDTEYDW